MLACKENWKDIQKYYLNTYVKFSGEGDRIWFITKVNDQMILAKDSAGEEAFIELADSNFTLDYVLPKKAVYQYGENAACLYRLPQRMWKKGLSEENTQLQILGNQWVNMPFNIGTIEGFVNKPGYYAFEDAKNQFNNGSALQSCALSPRVSLTRKGGVFIDTVLVGRLSKSALSVKEIYISDVAPLFPETKVKAV